MNPNHDEKGRFSSGSGGTGRKLRSSTRKSLRHLTDKVYHQRDDRFGAPRGTTRMETNASDPSEGWNQNRAAQKSYLQKETGSARQASQSRRVAKVERKMANRYMAMSDRTGRLATKKVNIGRKISPATVKNVISRRKKRGY